VLNAAVAIEMQRKARKSLLSTDPLTLVAEVKNTVGKSIFSKLAKSVGSRIFGPLDGFYKDYRAKMEKLGHPDISKALIQQGAINQVERGVLIAEVALLKRELRESNAEKEGLRQDKAVLQERVREKDEEIVALKEDNGVKDEKLLVQDEKLLVQDEKLLVQDERLREKDEQLREKDVRLLARDEIIVLLRKNVEEQNEKNRALEQRLLRVEAALMLPADTNIAAAEFSPPLLPLAAASSSSSSTTTVVASYRELQRKNSRSSSDSEENEQRKNSSSSSVLGEDLDKKGPVNEDENGDNKENSHSPQTYRLM